MGFGYHSVHEDDVEVEKQSESPARSAYRSLLSWSPYITVVLAIVTLTAATIVGFLAGRLYSLTHERVEEQRPGAGWPKPVVELDSIPLTIVSNRTYLEKPSPKNDKVWEALYPEDLHGVFQWPDENPRRSGFAGFHQLHCVDALRRVFYQEQEVKEALIRGENISNIPQSIKKVHVLHCIEVLRNSVMCHADNTLQVEASFHEGIQAFGTTSECKNWFQMVEWVNERNKIIPP